jgi:hypothetical protein
MSVKAKFICLNMETGATPESATIVSFNAIYGTEGENADYAKATPSGQLLMGIDPGTTASTFFELGKSYYLTFEQAGE